VWAQFSARVELQACAFHDNGKDWLECSDGTIVQNGKKVSYEHQVGWYGTIKSQLWRTVGDDRRGGGARAARSH
jgi:hypothetical protein